MICALLAIVLLTPAMPSTQPALAADSGFIKWVDFTPTVEAMETALNHDIKSQNEKVKLNWIELLAYAGAKLGGDFKKYKNSIINDCVKKLKSGEESMSDLTSKMKLYGYYLEAYSAALGGLVGSYRLEKPDSGDQPVMENQYGLKGFLPIARGFDYNDFDDFGTGRSFGFKRKHLGHDMMCLTGTPVIAVESGYVEAVGWNKYGGWRIGIRSFDGKRYYYYAHLRKNRPFHADIKQGATVKAGDVIGYVGRSGYSSTENTNGIKESHLHFGMQLIFDESQKEGNNEIWIDTYQIIQLLKKKRCTVVRNPETKEYSRKYAFIDDSLPDMTGFENEHPSNVSPAPENAVRNHSGVDPDQSYFSDNATRQSDSPGIAPATGAPMPDTPQTGSPAATLQDAPQPSPSPPTQTDSSADVNTHEAALLNQKSPPAKDAKGISQAEFLGESTEDIPVLLPIIMYHKLSNNPSLLGKFSISPAEFESDLAFLSESGYTSVTMEDVLAYVNDGIPLPKKPVILSFDDGDHSIHRMALPLLQKYGMKAVVAIIGTTTDEYTAMVEKDGYYPNMTWPQINELRESGSFEIQSHSYDLHKRSGKTLGALKRSSESSEEYRDRLSNDRARFMSRISETIGGELPTTFVYPFGARDKISDNALRELGFSATFSSYEGINRLRAGDQNSLFGLRRNLRAHNVPVKSIFNKLKLSVSETTDNYDSQSKEMQT